jgi:hypothetical protein
MRKCKEIPTHKSWYYNKAVLIVVLKVCKRGWEYWDKYWWGEKVGGVAGKLEI